MSRIVNRKPFFDLVEVCTRWSLSEADIAAFVLGGEITLSIAVGGLRVETSDQEEDVDGRPFSIPTGTRWVVGTMDLNRTHAWAILKQASHPVSRFYGVDGEMLDIPDKDDEPGALLVERQALVVRRAEMERFEEVQGLAPPGSSVTTMAAAVLRGSPRGAPPKYDWEACWCEMIAKMIYDPGPPATQAEWLRLIQDWFADRYGPDNVPCESSIKLRLSKIWRHVKPDTGRPSALSAVKDPNSVRPAEKGRPRGR